MIIKPDPIRPLKLSQVVEQRLLQLIQEEQLVPGDPMPSERELMDLYRVGRPAIREAMQNLQRMGLVEIRHGDRPKVAAPTLQALVDQMGVSMRHLLTHSASSLVHLKEARAMLEAEMARIAANKRDGKDIEALRTLIDKQAKSSTEPKTFLELDGAFHRRIAAISGNPIFESVSSAIFDWLRVFHVDVVRKAGLESLTLEEHQVIFDAIEAGDADAASRAMHDHLVRVNRLYHQSNIAPSTD